ncbi:MAG TPA: amidohydrolase family protein [Candidatus Atribacteria bacterium]|nr:amidohydrolase family protein [Candidatus Atribacteria bacterium]
MKNKKIVIKGTIIDGLNKEPIKQGVIIIEEKTIIAIGKEGEVKIPEGAEVFQGETIMPGMIDCHIHFCLNGEANFTQLIIQSSLSTYAIKAVNYAKRTIESGFTTVRELGSPAHIGVSLRDAVKKGIIPGPRILTSGQPLSITGGHGTFLPPWIHSDFDLGLFADGVEEVRKAVRALIGSGVDLIKLLATGGVMDVTTSPGAQNYNLDELKVAAEEAHKLGKKVAAHVEGLSGAKDCIRAGIDTLEHGIELDDEAIQMMIDNGTFLVPTLLAPYNIAEHGVEGGIPELAVKKDLEVIKEHAESFKKAYQAGVKIAMGTDMGTPFSKHGENAKELELMVNNGMSPIEAIMSTTRVASEAIGLEKSIGTLEKGKLADLIILDGDPLTDITLLQKKEFIKLVMKEGKIVVKR